MIREKEIQSYFDNTISYHMEMALRQDAIGYNYREKVGWFIRRLSGVEGRLLNVGCNTGNLEYFIRDHGISSETLELTGIDIAQKAVEMARSRNIANSTFQLGSAINLDFPDNTFDAVTLMEVIEHIPDQRKAVDEIARVLKPGGILLLSTPNSECKPWLFDERLRFMIWRLLGRRLVDKDKPFTLPEMKALLRGSGLTVRDDTDYYWYRPYHVFKGRIWWPPNLAIKGLLGAMKHCKEIEEGNSLENEKKHYYCQSIVAATVKSAEKL